MMKKKCRTAKGTVEYTLSLKLLLNMPSYFEKFRAIVSKLYKLLGYESQTQSCTPDGNCNRYIRGKHPDRIRDLFKQYCQRKIKNRFMC